jgi:Zn-dependent protease with chaperone function
MSAQNLYSLKDKAKIGFTLAAQCAVFTAGALLITNPWYLAAGVTVAAFSMYQSIKTTREIMGGHLKRYNDWHPHSPNLGFMVKELYERTGLSDTDYPIYDLQAREDSALPDTQKKSLAKLALTPNAMAFKIDKPVIMITEPLLELLTDEEEYAVLAHEFVHAKADHILFRLPFTFMATTLGSAFFFATVGEIVSAGLQPLLLAAASIAALPKILDFVEEKFDLKRSSLYDLVEALTPIVAPIAILAAANAAILPTAGLYIASSIASLLAVSALSRINEYQADREATSLGANPLALITSLRKLTALQERVNNKPTTAKKDWFTKAFSTHPALKERTEALARKAKQLNYSLEEINEGLYGSITLPERSISRYAIDATLKR